MASRPDILDRNGEILATDIRTVSLYAEPHKIVDADEAVEHARDRAAGSRPSRHLQQAVTSKSRFQWLRRQLTPKQQSEILALGIPGIGFRPEKRRFYPGGVDGLAYSRPRQHRQPRHCRHGTLYRQPGTRRSRRHRHDERCQGLSRSSCPSICACRTSCAMSSSMR